jgi:L-iditol 2-dehydrogenase
MKKELDILGVWRYRWAYPPAIALLASKRVRVDALITHRFSLDQVDEALLTCSEMRGKPIKVVVSVED